MFLIRKVKIADTHFIKNLETEAGLGRWTKRDYLLEIDRTGSLFFIAISHDTGERCGFIIARLIMYSNINPNEGEIEIYNLAVRKQYRRNRVGSLLLDEIVRRGDESKVCGIRLEVRKSNIGAISFYQKNHFKIVGERRNFYTDPLEDAVLMTRDMALSNDTIT